MGKHRLFSGRKRRFGLAGAFNVVITNLTLQLLLASNIVSVATATLISQALNTTVGYLIYGKLVFRSSRMRRHTSILKYLALMLCIWMFNTSGIMIGVQLGIGRGIAAAGMILPMAMVSYGIQKIWIFRK